VRHMDDARGCEIGHCCPDHSPPTEKRALVDGEEFALTDERTEEGTEAVPSWSDHTLLQGEACKVGLSMCCVKKHLRCHQ